MADAIVHEKICPYCHLTKPVSAFHIKRSSKSGFRSRCKICRDLPRKPVNREVKTCSSCKIEKPRSEFYPRKERTHTRAGIHSECKKCTNAASRARQLNNPPSYERRKSYNRNRYHSPEGKLQYLEGYYKRTYGISFREYNLMVAKQGGRCAICLMLPDTNPRAKRLFVDHDHQTGKIRGLLCTACNLVLGRWKDSPETAERARLYLLRHRQLTLVK